MIFGDKRIEYSPVNAAYNNKVNDTIPYPDEDTEDEDEEAENLFDGINTWSSSL